MCLRHSIPLVISHGLPWKDWKESPEILSRRYLKAFSLIGSGMMCLRVLNLHKRYNSSII